MCNPCSTPGPQQPGYPPGRHLRATDVLARWGGEEFVVLLPHGNVQAAARLAEKLRLATLAQPFPVAGTLTLSLGVTG